MKSLSVHYRNKYPGGKVIETEESLDVFDAKGDHCVALRKNGAGIMSCQSMALGCKHTHDLAPIPKDARLFKMRDGKLSKDEKYEERVKAHKDFLCGDDSKVLSCAELSEQGYKFDASQKLVDVPK